MRNMLITLITEFKEGVEIKKKETAVYAEQKSVGRTEYYASVAAGLTAQYIFDVYPDEYHLGDKIVEDKVYHPSKVLFEGFEYNITRTYSKSCSSIELTVGRGK